MTVNTDPQPQTDERLAALESEVRRLRDVESIRRLQNMYGYYLDENRADDLIDLYTRNEPRFYFRGGAYIGRAGLERFYKHTIAAVFGYTKTGPMNGTLASHYQLQDVVDVPADGTTAVGRFELLQLTLVHPGRAGWSSALYDIDYVKEGGVWKFQSLRYTHLWSLANTPDSELFPLPEDAPAGPPPGPVLFPEDPLGPDRLDDRPLHIPFPMRASVPLRFPNPVTGREWPIGLAQTESRPPGATDASMSASSRPSPGASSYS